MTFEELRLWVEAANRSRVVAPAIVDGVARGQLLRLLDAAKSMRDQRADDRCWLDADALYAAAGLPPPDRRVGDRFAMLKNCVRYVDQACEGGGPWKSYAELEADLTETVRQRDEARRHLARLDTEFEALRPARGA